ncbi:kinase domain protein [Oesophagostomum dentatum]|uniref:mitogen-activated protein kinase kinase n=1 Tax=Oesophagostomum dentatum TaxID=61180 RepID=A0A0B1TKV8_OESDE|nr:kinase domain protein [Oesophagostomum dentatum]
MPSFFRRCLGCGFALFCGKECQTLGWKDHKAECKGLRKVSSIPDIEIRMLGRIVLRYKEICSGKDKKTEDFYKDRTSKRSLLEIWSHTDLIRNDHYAMTKFEDIYKQLSEFYEAKFLLPKEMVFELHCRDYINRHAISDRGYMNEIGKGLYLDLCAYDHSCRPNTIYTCNGFIATLRALNPNVAMEDKTKTFYSYIDLLSSQQQRKKQLKDTWYFDCQCERCTDPDDHILTSILCPLCPANEREALSIFGEHAHKNAKSAVITCTKCGNEVPKQLIPLTPPNNNEELLRLHLQAESCVRRCFPHNHPANAFHLRNIGIFLNNLDRCEEAVKYFREADEILEFTLDSDHPMTVENRAFLKQAMKNLGLAEEEKNSAPSESTVNNGKTEGEDAAPKEERKETKKQKKSGEQPADNKPALPAEAPPNLVSLTKNLSLNKLADLFSDDIASFLLGFLAFLVSSFLHFSNPLNTLRNYIRMYLAGKLVFPPDTREYPFEFKDLEELGPLGNGSYGTVKKMRHILTGTEMAVKRVRIVSSGVDDVASCRSMKRLQQEVDAIKSASNCKQIVQFYGITFHERVRIVSSGVDDVASCRSMKRLQQEVDAIKSASNCKQIVQFYGITFHEGDGLVCMELMDISLERLYTAVHDLGYPAFDENTLGSVAINVIIALNHMKSQYHIIHRDVKPSNILLNRRGDVKLCDFGICGYLQDSVAQTQDAGCRPYMAPERLIAFSKGYDIRSDVWSLGISMVEVANFAFPYPGFTSAPLFAQLDLVVHGDAPMVNNPLYSTRTKNFIHYWNVSFMFSLTKDLKSRPTFVDLANTPFYQHYSSMEDLSELVGAYVAEVLDKIESN